MKNKTELPVCDTPIFTAFLEYAFPCAILQSDKRLQNLLYVSFIDLYWNNNCNEKLQLYNFNLFDYLLFDYRLIDETIIDLDSKINNRIKKWIDEGYYIYAFIDETKLNSTQLSNRPTEIHESLIHGYDDNFDSFSILNFDENKKFGKIIIRQKDLKRACLSKTTATKFLLLKPSFDMVNIEIKLIEKRINYYLEGKNIEIGKCRNILTNDYKWGINVYEELFQYINTTNSLDFRIFKLLEEHKVYLHEVYRYLLPLIKNDGLETEYLKLIELTKKMNLFILKQNSVEKTEQKHKILNLITDINKKEKCLLRNFSKNLRCYLNEHEIFNNIEYLD